MKFLFVFIELFTKSSICSYGKPIKSCYEADRFLTKQTAIYCKICCLVFTVLFSSVELLFVAF